MGKAWRGGKGGDAKAHDIPSCKGYPVVMGTCDAARERETSKELVNLLNDAIEELYPVSAAASTTADKPCQSSSLSIEEMLRAEIEQVKDQKHAATQNAVSVNTGVKGITLIKILRKECCPVKLVEQIFDKVEKEKNAVCRFVVRIIPLQTVFFPEREEVVLNFRTLMRASLGLPPLPTIRAKKRPAEENDATDDHDDDGEQKEEEGAGEEQGEATTQAAEATASPCEHKKQRTDAGDPSPAEDARPSEAPSSLDLSAPLPTAEAEVWHGAKIPYYVMFKARNHNVLGRDSVLSAVQECMSLYGYGDFRTPQVVVLVEALKSICGVSWLPQYKRLCDLNIRKHQQVHVHGLDPLGDGEES